MEVVEVLAVDEEVEHVVALATHLQTNLHPVQLGRLEELGRLERPEQVPLFLRLGWTVFECIQHKVLEELLVGHAHLHWHAGWTVLPVPATQPLFQQYPHTHVCKTR
ncbi:hypothetical protein NP493_12g04016 [Ridgeia piscesae]|uniref:Uncharacterized protein n=1 Tax=Ridgeia piscesae TaxID=27915 RepID=A0AAD9UL34_RIDPI|nr:hypothetical protein NP493_12g04016 [Ridgeia piscesae]